MSLLGISVIIPTRNRPAFLQEAVASVCAQTQAPAELLVIDDGAGAQEALAPLLPEAPFPVHVLASPGAGPGAARNLGLRAAQGEWVAFLDDDDLWHPEKLAWQAEWMARYPRLGVLGTEGAKMTASGWPAVRPPHRLRVINQTALIHANHFIMSSVLARKECLVIDSGFDVSLPLAQDWDRWLRITPAWELAIVPAPLTHYRQHVGQRSIRQAEMRHWEGEVIARALMAQDSRGGQAMARRRLAWARCREGRALLRAHRPQQAAQVLWESFWLNPMNPVVWSTLARCHWAQFAVIGTEKS